MLIDLDKLCVANPALHRTISLFLGYTSGTYEMDLDSLPPQSRARLRAFVKIQKQEPAQPSQFDQRLAEFQRQQVPKPAAVEPIPPPAPPVPDGPLPEQIRMKDLEAEFQADLRRAIDERGAKIRLQRFADEEGLLPTDENAATVKAYLDRELKGYLSAKGVELAVLNEGPRGRNLLKFRPPVAQPPPAPVVSAEVHQTLSDGTTQLPLDVSNAVLQRASKEQARDWLARTREATGKYLRPRNSFGAKFI